MSSEKLPVITDEMIFALDKIFPHRHPDLSLTDREVWYRAGQRFVVDFLIEQQKRQKETMLTNTVLENKPCVSEDPQSHHHYQHLGLQHQHQKGLLRL